MKAAGNMLKYIEIIPSGKAFRYRLKHNAIQARTNKMGFFVLFTNTRMSAEDILRIYMQKDVVEKAFKAMHATPACQNGDRNIRLQPQRTASSAT